MTLAARKQLGLAAGAHLISCSASRCIAARERKPALQGGVNAGAELAPPCPLVVLSRTTLPNIAVQDTERYADGHPVQPKDQSPEGGPRARGGAS